MYILKTVHFFNISKQIRKTIFAAKNVMEISEIYIFTLKKGIDQES